MIRPGAREQWPPGRVLLYAAVAYVALTTADFEIGPFPGKLFVIGVALIAWASGREVWRAEGRQRLADDFSFSAPVLVLAVVVPVVWFLVAAWRAGHDSPAQPSDDLTYALQEASRFVYLLLYFPLVDEMRGRPFLVSQRVWLAPTFVLCALTIALFLGGTVIGVDYTPDRVGPFEGAIGPEPTGTFRVFVVDDVLLVPAVAVMLAQVRLHGLSDWTGPALAALVVTLYLAHARGLWIAVCLAAAGLVLLDALLPRGRRLRLAAAGAATVALATGFVINAAPTLAADAVSAVSGRSELSTTQRLAQAPELWDAIEEHPIVGSGLGATLPSGFQRNPDSPWSFELSYLQLWFQIGAIGLALVLYLPLWVLWRVRRRWGGLAEERRTQVAACTLGLLGLMFAFGGNPYLLTSVGMLALAIFAAMADRLLHTSTDHVTVQ